MNPQTVRAGLARPTSTLQWIERRNPLLPNIQLIQSMGLSGTECPTAIARLHRADVRPFAMPFPAPPPTEQAQIL